MMTLPVMDPSGPRSRPVLLAATIVTIALGLASRRWPVLPDVLGKYPGDCLWALMVVLLLGALFPRTPTRTLVLVAAGFSLLIEGLKLVPALEPLRDHPLGHLVFGHVFSWLNLVAYAIGIAFGAVIDRLLRVGT
jgi:threonine/homoserine/homoserine lactone efflux protein